MFYNYYFFFKALKLLCTAELKPYVIFVKPPPFELLKETRNSAQSSFDENYSRGFTVSVLYYNIYYNIIIIYK